MSNHEQNIKTLLEKRGKSGLLQQLAELLLKRETNWNFTSHPGILEGTSHPIKGKIDLWFQDQEGHFIAIQPTSERSRTKLESDTKKGIYALSEIKSPAKGRVVLFCSRDIDVTDRIYCEKLCTRAGLNFDLYDNSKISSLLLKKQNLDLTEKYLGYKISHKKPVIEVEPINKELFNLFEYKLKIKNIGDDYLTFEKMSLTRHFSHGIDPMTYDYDFNRSIGANGDTIKIDVSNNIPDNRFNSLVTHPNEDYIVICLAYKDSNGERYTDYFKYTFLRLDLKWNSVLIERLNKNE